MALRTAGRSRGMSDVDEDVADQQAEPANLDGDGFGGQLPETGGGS